MNALCPTTINIELVRTTWPDCWQDGDGGTIGKSIEDGTVDGCMTYIHTHIRDGLAEFSAAMLDDNKAAGLLTMLDENGNPMVTGMSDLKGKTLIDVAGWAPSADALNFVTNQCTGQKYSQDINVVVAEIDEPNDNPNDVAMQMLHDGEGDAIFLMADSAKTYEYCPTDAVWNCTLWSGFGTQHAYVQSGQFGYVKNGTTFAISKKGSGIREVLSPCMSAYMASIEYYRICSKYNIVDKCYKNNFFDDDARSVPVYDKPTSDQFGDCSDGYCPCDAGLAADESNTDTDNNEEPFPTWAIIVIVVGSVVALALLAGGCKLYQKRRQVQQQRDLEVQQARDLKLRVLNHARKSEATAATNLETGTISSNNTPPVRSWRVES